MGAFLAFKALPWKLIGVAALGLFIASLFVTLKIERAQNGKLKAQITACTAARQADRSAYESAQREAATLNKAHVAKVEADQQRISDETASDLNTRLERLRSELRAKPAAPKGSAGGTSPPANGGAAKGIDDPARVCLAPEELLRGAENEERHDQLISWIEKQLEVAR